MADMLVRTKGNSNPKGKPRVYFTCHPEDFDKYFDRICEDIFKTQDCAIYYTEDMRQEIEEADKETDLESNNLFVVPVTFRLLSQPNRAMDADIPFALEKQIPVLPFMMESGIDSFYSSRFGELQYLSPFSRDTTEISYAEKLKKHLEAVLISNEMATRIRAAFDAYIFLSYRKKDRRYANELMRLIHSYPECRDIAIWYDEFLSPGESFRESIYKVLSSSKLFALLVTPNLLEEPEGKPNFVMGEEYPAAIDSGIAILPAEMVQTDKRALNHKFRDIPPCVRPGEDAFRERLLRTVSQIATTADGKDPVHTFLIGLAYLEGIDVETDRQRGLQLITDAAEQNLPEAMEKLYRMYYAGAGVQLDYEKAAYWAEKLTEHYIQTCGTEHPDTITAQSNLAVIYGKLGRYQQELDAEEAIYTQQVRLFGEAHPDTLLSLVNLAATYGNLGNYEKALELEEQAYRTYCELLGEQHPHTLRALSNLAVTCGELGDHRKALELNEMVYELRKTALGEKHPETLSSLGNLAAELLYLGDPQSAQKLAEQNYALRCELFGREHPGTLLALCNLATTYGLLGDHQKEQELEQIAYSAYGKLLGEEHPHTLDILSNLVVTCSELGDYYKALELAKKVYTLRCKIFGEAHPDTQCAYEDYRVLCEALGVCPHCGGKFTGLFKKVCRQCGKPKDY